MDQLSLKELKRYIHPDFDHLQLGWLGDDLELGPRPALFYFALSLEDSLLQAPFNYPARLVPDQCRLFSATLPFHQRGQNEQHTLEKWIESEQQQPFIEAYLDHLAEGIAHLAFAYSELHLIGLSRGSWICLQLVDRLKKRNIEPQTLTLFAPLCDFSLRAGALPLIYQPFDVNLCDEKLWMSISCHDTRVGTEKALSLFQKQQAYDPKGLRQHRLILYPAVGYKGHGTPDEIFIEGMQWLCQHIKK